MVEGMASPAQVARGARMPAFPAPLAMIAGSLSVQLGGAVAVHAFARSTALDVHALALRDRHPRRRRALALVLGRTIAHATVGAAGLVPACAISAALLAGPGIASARASLVEPRLVGLCVVLGLLGTAIPYAIALRPGPGAGCRFSVLLSMHPAVAALVGAAALSQGLSLRDVVAIACVVAASAGALAAAARAPAAQ